MSKVKFNRKYLFLTAFLSFSLAFPMINMSNVKAEGLISTNTYKTQRISGNNRYLTSISVSKYGWKNESKYLILASGENYADALCAVPLAKKYNCPVLLTSKDNLNEDIFREIKRLNPQHVYIMGKDGAVSKKVEDKIKNIGSSIKVERIGGDNRYETSVKAAEKLNDDNKVNEAALCSGSTYADALSIASAAAIKNMPIILTNKDSIPAEVKKFVHDSNLSNVYIVGSNGVISNKVEGNFKSFKRLAGKNRYETNYSVMNEFKDIFSKDTLFVAAGGPYESDFADALSGSALAAINNAPVLLFDKVTYNHASKVPSVDFNSNVNVIAFGGDKVLPDSKISNMISKIANTSKESQNDDENAKKTDESQPAGGSEGAISGGGSGSGSSDSSESQEDKLLNEINKCSKGSMRSLIEDNKEKLSVSSSYNKLDDGRKIRVGSDLFDNKPSNGFKDLDEVKDIIDELIEARLIVQRSLNDVNDAESIDDIKDGRFLKDVYDYLDGNRKFNMFSDYNIDNYSGIVHDSYDNFCHKNGKEKEAILKDILHDKPYESYGDLLEKLM